MFFNGVLCNLVRMKLLAGLGLIFVSAIADAQTTLQVHAGFGYTEHFSAGVGCTFSNKHQIAFLYGSNFFSKPREFSTFMVHYNFILKQWRFAGLVPTLGIKGGHVIFTDTYYTWEVATFVPFAGIRYPVNERFYLLVHAGGAFSFEQKVKRLNYGEIGHYRDLLPEIKAGLVFHLAR